MFRQAIVLEDYDHDYEIRWCHTTLEYIERWQANLQSLSDIDIELG